MNKKTLRATLGSINKWWLIREKMGGDNGWKNCPLCKVFNTCEDGGCPIKLKVNESGCRNTPCIAWDRHHEKKHGSFYPRKVKCPTCKKLANKELQFLIDLLTVKQRKTVRKLIKDNSFTITKALKLM